MAEVLVLSRGKKGVAIEKAAGKGRIGACVRRQGVGCRVGPGVYFWKY